MKNNTNSVFTTIRAYNKKVFRLNEHLQRLRENMFAAGMFAVNSKIKNQKSKPVEFIKKLEENIKKELEKSKLKDARIRVAVDGKNLNITVTPLPCYPADFYTNGVKLITVPTIRNISSATDAQIKSGNFLAGIMAKIESRDAFDAVMLNKDGYVTETTISNIFILQKRSTGTKKLHTKLWNVDCLPRRQASGLWTLITPPSYMGALGGVTRNTVIEIAKKMGIAVEEIPFTKYNLYNADECFLTNTTMEIMPVTEIDARIIGNGKPGRLTKKLMEKFKKYVTELFG